jgi:hypothetical protein
VELLPNALDEGRARISYLLFELDHSLWLATGYADVYMSVIIRPPQADDRIIYFAVYVDSPIESGNDKVFNTPQQAAGKY